MVYEIISEVGLHQPYTLTQPGVFYSLLQVIPNSLNLIRTPLVGKSPLAAFPQSAFHPPSSPTPMLFSLASARVL